MKTETTPNWLKSLPNRLTYLRILCIPIVVYLMSYGIEAVETVRFWEMIPLKPTITDIIAACVFAIAALTDFLDGWVARKFQLETMLGKLLDPLADKLLIVSALIILVEKHRMAGWVAVILIVRDLGINAIRLAAIDDGIHIASSWLGKSKTACLDIGIIGLTVYGSLWQIPFHYIGQIFILLAFLASVVSAAQYLFEYATQLKKKSQIGT